MNILDLKYYTMIGKRLI